MINIDEYLPRIKWHMSNLGLSCIYLISPKEGSPTKIGIAGDIYKRIVSIQASNWVDLELKYILWMPGVEASKVVETKLLSLFVNHCIRGEWFNLNYTEIMPNIEPLARYFYPTVVISSHDEVIKRINEIIADEVNLWDRRIQKVRYSHQR